MRYTFFLGVALLTFTCCCSESIDDATNYKSEDTTPSIESLLKIDQNKYKNWQNSSSRANTRASFTDYTVYSYTSKSSTGTRKAICGSKLASLMHIYNQIYISEIITANYVFTVDGLSTKTVRFSANESPNCGLFPDYSNDTLEDRGYSATQKGDVITMTTKLIHIISDIQGIVYDKWYPCKPEELEWSYCIYNK